MLARCYIMDIIVDDGLMLFVKHRLMIMVCDFSKSLCDNWLDYFLVV